MIYKNVLALCEKHGITVGGLERALGLGNATIRGWQTSSPRVSTVKVVAEYFGVTVDELLKED